MYPPSLKGAPKDTMNKRRKFFLLSIGLFSAQRPKSRGGRVEAARWEEAGC